MHVDESRDLSQDPSLWLLALLKVILQQLCGQKKETEEKKKPGIRTGVLVGRQFEMPQECPSAFVVSTIENGCTGGCKAADLTKAFSNSSEQSCFYSVSTYLDEYVLSYVQ